MPIPTLPTWTVGAKITASKLTQVGTAVSYLLDPPRVLAFDGAGVSCTNNTATLIPWNSELWDTDTMHDTVTNPSRVTINTTGTYAVTVAIRFGLGPTFTTFNVNIRRNAAGSSSGGTSTYTFTQGAPGGGPATARFYCELPLIAAEYYEVFVTQKSTAARTTEPGGVVTGFTARLISV